MKSHHLVMLLIGVVIALAVVGKSDSDEAERQQNEYCEMVKLWKQSSGEKGWPAYKGESMCR